MRPLWAWKGAGAPSGHAHDHVHEDGAHSHAHNHEPVGPGQYDHGDGTPHAHAHTANHPSRLDAVLAARAAKAADTVFDVYEGLSAVQKTVVRANVARPPAGWASRLTSLAADVDSSDPQRREWARAEIAKALTAEQSTTKQADPVLVASLRQTAVSDPDPRQRLAAEGELARLGAQR